METSTYGTGFARRVNGSRGDGGLHGEYAGQDRSSHPEGHVQLSQIGGYRGDGWGWGLVSGVVNLKLPARLDSNRRTAGPAGLLVGTQTHHVMWV
jgi:hypothetical protein